MYTPRIRLLKLASVALATALATLGAGTAAHAEYFYGLTSGNRIVTFDSTTPGVIKSSGAISGLAAGDTLLGLDLRPANRTLYSVGSSGRLYSIAGNGNGYVATTIGSIPQARTGTNFGLDFNPTVDRLRLVSDANINLRINPGNPGGSLTDTNLTLNGSPRIDLLGVAYTNSRPGAKTTTLYGLDAISNGLVRATNANAGTYTTTSLTGAIFGGLGVDLDNSESVDFDISGGSGRGFFQVANAFYSVNLASGAGSFIGTIGEAGIIGLTSGAVPEPQMWAMLIVGFGLVGVTMRRRKPAAATA